MGPVTTTTTTTRVPPTADPATTTRVPPTVEEKTPVVELLPVESVVTVVTTLNEEKPGDELKQIEADTAVVAAQSSSDCLTKDIEVCEPKSSMECNIEYEEICTEVEQETCEKVTTCKTVYKNVCEGGVCTP